MAGKGARTVRHDGWTARRKARFLAVLGETCNVTAAVAAAGLARHSAYTLRARDPAFAQRWQEALALGYDRLETELLRHAIDALVDAEAPVIVGDDAEVDGAATDGEADPAGDTGTGGEGTGGEGTGGGGTRRAVATPPSKSPRPGSGLTPGTALAPAVQLGLALLNRHRATIEGRNRPMPHGTATAAETDAALLRQIAKLGPRPEPAA